MNIGTGETVSYLRHEWMLLVLVTVFTDAFLPTLRCYVPTGQWGVALADFRHGPHGKCADAFEFGWYGAECEAFIGQQLQVTQVFDNQYFRT